MLRPSKKRLLLLVPISPVGCGGSGESDGNSSPAFVRVLTSSLMHPAAFAISGDGQTAAGTSNYHFAGAGAGGIAWADGEEFFPSAASDATFSAGSSVNADGSVIVGTGRSSVLGTTTGIVPYRWSRVGGTTILTIPDTYSSAFATGVDATGSTVVGTELPSGTSTSKAFRWFSGATTLLPALPGTTSWGAGGISSDGQVTVGSADTRAVYWTGTNTPIAISPPDQTASAVDVSQNGSVIVGNTVAASSVDSVAFRWTAGGFELLGTLPGYTQSTATSVSDDGTIVVGNAFTAGDRPETFQPFIWTAASGMRQLRNVLTGSRYQAIKDVEVIQVTDLSKDGRTVLIVAYDYFWKATSYAVRLPKL